MLIETRDTGWVLSVERADKEIFRRRQANLSTMIWPCVSEWLVVCSLSEGLDSYRTQIRHLLFQTVVFMKTINHCRGI